MAKLRKFVAYRRLERPYTRVSKYREKSFVRARPHSKVVRYTQGNQHKEFKYTLYLVSKEALQIRHNAIESARQTANKVLDKKIGKLNYFFKYRIYPHHILRENPLVFFTTLLGVPDIIQYPSLFSIHLGGIKEHLPFLSKVLANICKFSLPYGGSITAPSKIVKFIFTSLPVILFIYGELSLPIGKT